MFEMDAKSPVEVFRKVLPEKTFEKAR